MIDQYPPANGVLTSLIWRKTAAGGETSLSGYDNASQALSYTPGQEQVYLNGILLVRGDDYTATNGTSITGLTALAAGDFVQINCYNNFSVASVPTTSLTGEVTNSQITSLATSKLTGTIANNQLANSSITINGNAVSLGGSVSLPGDIEGVTSGIGISGGGTSGTITITNDMATTISAKGDLVVGTANDAYAALTVGANNTILTADSSTATGLKWGTVSAGGMTLLSTTTLTGQNVTITNISQDYTDLYIVIYGLTPGADAAALMNFRNNSTDLYTYSYGFEQNIFSGAQSTNYYLAAQDPFRGGDNQNNIVIQVSGYASTTQRRKSISQTGMFRNSGPTYGGIALFGYIDDNLAVNSLYFDLAGTNTFSGGTVLIYGVK